MATAEQVGNILRKTSLQLDELIHRALEASEEDCEQHGDDLERAHTLVKHSTDIITEIRLKKLREIYTEKTLEVPYWFRNIFNDGSIIVELVPTFNTVMLNACREFKDMLTAKMSLTLSSVDALLIYSRPETCRINVSENIRFASPPSPSNTGSDVIYTPWRRPLTFVATGNERFCNRRVSLAGMIDEGVGYPFGKTAKCRRDVGVRIIFINNKSNANDDSTCVTGTYRRLMATRDKYLTWKFVL